jgi:hypothetical protein
MYENRVSITDTNPREGTDEILLSTTSILLWNRPACKESVSGNSLTSMAIADISPMVPLAARLTAASAAPYLRIVGRRRYQYNDGLLDPRIHVR